MFVINDDQSIYLTRGDVVPIEVGAITSEDTDHIFQIGDIVRLRVFEKNRHDKIVLKKDVHVTEETTIVNLYLTSDETRIGDLINSPKDYWYEIEVNPETAPQTIIGYDVSGPKIFRLYPEGADE